VTNAAAIVLGAVVGLVLVIAVLAIVFWQEWW
jgi:hypothetical protein